MRAKLARIPSGSAALDRVQDHLVSRLNPALAAVEDLGTAVAGLQAAQAVPAGAILSYGVATPPAGYLVCDGSAVSRRTYAALFAVVGTAFGVGDGASTFNLPSLSPGPGGSALKWFVKT